MRTWNHPHVARLVARLWMVMIAAVAMVSAGGADRARGAGPSIDEAYARDIRPLLERFCFECHDQERAEAEIDLSSFESMERVRQQPKVWVKVSEMLESAQMPPKDALQPDDMERATLYQWVKLHLTAEAKASAGDPGPVVLRRLSNAEYGYTIQDLTGIPSLDPTREFPVDGAAGEGFTNTGAALVMSPSLVQKYLDAAKEVADHLVLFPDGVRFSEQTSSRDLTDERLTAIREVYARYTGNSDGTAVNLQGIQFDTNQGGALPLIAYMTATVVEREALESGSKSISGVAAERGLSPVYLAMLWEHLQEETSDTSFLLQDLRQQWRKMEVGEIPQFAAAISQWQALLWKFNVVGHMGRSGAPQSWMQPLVPIQNRQEYRIPLPESVNGEDVIVYLEAKDIGDGNREQDYVLWRDMRLTAAGEPPLRVRDLQGIAARQEELQQQLLEQIEISLVAAAEAMDRTDLKPAELEAIAVKHRVTPLILRTWLDYLSVGIGGPVQIEGHFTGSDLPSQYDFINGWGTDATPLIIANSSDQEVRIPGIAKPHSLVVHPSPTLYSAIGWQSPIDGFVEVNATVSDAHPECGNGVEWYLQYRSGTSETTLWSGDFEVGGRAEMPTKKVAVTRGEVISLLVGPRGGEHTCDLTAIELTITEMGGSKQRWDAAEDNSPNITQANPHPDSYGNENTWHFYRNEMSTLTSQSKETSSVPPRSLLARWLELPAERTTLAQQIAELVHGPAPRDGAETTPDGVLYRSLHAMTLPLDAAWVNEVEADPRFGQHPLGHAIDPDHLVVQAPATVEIRIPAALTSARELTVVGMFDVGHGTQGTTQIRVSVGAPGAEIPFASPILCGDDEATQKRVEDALSVVRDLFPPALCYTRIVPVDEVVTSILFHREDRLYRRLMLDSHATTKLDRLWDELLFVSEEPLQAVVALEQIREFSTQDRQDLVPQWDALKPSVLARAEEFRQRKVATESVHLDSLLEIVDRAWRRNLTAFEQRGLRQLYDQFRQDDVAHLQAIRMTLVRALTSPHFLYRRERPGTSEMSAPVSGLEFASRLSYFLWSSLPDEELRLLGESNKLSLEGTARDQVQRMLQDKKMRRLAIHFACQWLHIRDFDQNDDKNEQLYPEFEELRDDMYEESVRFFEDMFSNDGSILDLLDADHMFINETLAQHYGIDGVLGEEWRRLEGAQALGRGGILGMATTLATNAGASRTSPILRGNWVYETLLGQRLPKPPANVPQLPEEVPTGLTERELIELHSSAPACAKCHVRIDPYGFALEQFDAIGRARSEPVDTRTVLEDGLAIEGIAGLRDYLLQERRDDVVRQFCGKLLGYSLGRELQLSDEPLLVDILNKLQANEYRFSVIVQAIVASRQFREIRSAPEGK